MLVMSASLIAAAGLLTTNAQATVMPFCGLHAVTVAGGNYVVDSNEYGSDDSECVSTNGGPDFTVADSGIDSDTGGPDAYPSIYAGCHWGLCSWGGLSTGPLRVSALKPGMLTTDWSTTQPDDGVYDASYDVWFNSTPETIALRPDCSELMVWLNHTGQVRPFGDLEASDVTVDGRTYDVYNGQQANWNTVSYELTTGVTSVHDLDIGSLALDAVNRGFLPSSCYLIDVEAGFELWQGGQGLATNSFSVQAGPRVPPSPAPPRSPSPSPSPSPSVRPTEAPAAGLTESGSLATITSEPSDAVIPAGGSVTVGSIATGATAKPGKFPLNGIACG